MHINSPSGTNISIYLHIVIIVTVVYQGWKNQNFQVPSKKFDFKTKGVISEISEINLLI